jgi:hypothetical protein
MSEGFIVKIPKAMIDDIRKRVWFQYYRDIEDFILGAMRSSMENWEKCAFAYEIREETDAKVENIEKRPTLVSTVPEEAETTEISQDTKPTGCPHYVGYLKKEHPKKTPIPNGCVTCNKIINCLKLDST